MPDIYPFRAIRYNLPDSKIRSAVCPPYDIIGESLAEKLRKTSFNAIHIELPVGAGDKKYIHAKKIWGQWNKKGILLRDDLPAFYLYEQIFSAEGKRYSRKGFFCELKVEKPGSGSILRHELTLSKPKEDRLKLIRALRANTSPIFGLFPDRRDKVSDLLKIYSKKKPAVEIKDGDGVLHRIWICSSPKDIKTIQEVLKKHSVVIADGHHRYETSWNYSRETGKKDGSAKVLFYLSPMEDPGIVIYPTHRVLKDKSVDLDRLVGKIKSFPDVFNMIPSPSPRPSPSNGFLISDGKKTYQVKLRSLKNLIKYLPKGQRISKELLKLPLVQIHSVILPEMARDQFDYTHIYKEAVQSARKEGRVAILVPPTSARELYSVVSKGELMPQKSTYFYPKVITGLIFRSLD